MIKDPYIGMPITMGNLRRPGGCIAGGNSSACSHSGNMNSSNIDPGNMGPGNMGSANMDPGSMRPGNMNSGSMSGDGTFDSMYLGSLPIAMAYVPMQQWKTTYSLSEALERGTLFPELDLPFMGRGGMRK